MAGFDPWAGYVEGMQSIGDTITSLQDLQLKREQAARQAAKDAMEQEKWGYEKSRLETEKADRDALAAYEQKLRGLRSSQVTEAAPDIPNPAYKAYMDSQAVGGLGPQVSSATGLGSVLPPTISGGTQTRPINPFEYAQQAEQARLEADPTGRRGFKSVDITAEIMNQAPLKIMQAHQKTGIAMNMYAQGHSPEEIAQVIGSSPDEVLKGMQNSKQIAPGILYTQKDGLGITLNYTGKGDPVKIEKLEKVSTHPDATFIDSRSKQLLDTGAASDITEAKLMAISELNAEKLKRVTTVEGVKQANRLESEQEKQKGRLELAGVRAGHMERLKRIIPGMTEGDYDTLATMATEGRLPANVSARTAAVLAQVDKRTGGSVDFNRLAADSSAQKKMKQISAIMEANEKDANFNFDRLEKLIPTLGNTGVPMLNSVINRIEKGLGAPEPGTAEAVAYEAMTRYAKVVTGQTTGQAVTDTAAKGARALLEVLRDTPKQSYTKIKEFRGMMADNKRAYSEAYESITGQSVRPVGGKTGTPAPSMKIASKIAALPREDYTEGQTAVYMDIATKVKYPIVFKGGRWAIQ